MGSKMAAATRVVQVVKPHAPLIKFPDRVKTPKFNVQEAVKTILSASPVASTNTHLDQQPAVSSARPPGLPSTATVRAVSGPPDTADAVKGLPLKYRRKALSLEEIEYIQRGGPE
ncbi:RT36 protein, partial [Polypterus senegalus]